jgi:hypothetical protein
VTVLAVGFPSIQSADADTTQHVFSIRDRFQMDRVYAEPDAAEMVKFKSLGDWADE